MRRPAVPVTPPDTRYWRRRANRRVRKARRARTLARWSVVLLLNLGVLGILAYMAFRAVSHMTDSERFHVRQIRIEGVGRSSRGALEARLAEVAGENLFDLDLARVTELAESDPWVRGSSVKRVFPDTLLVRIEEREPGALAVMDGRAWLIDVQGVVIGPTGPGMADDLPVLTGLWAWDGAEREAALRRGVRALERLQRIDADWAAEIVEVDLARPDRLRVRTAGVGPALLLDPERVERNVRSFLSLRRAIGERAGVAEYVDLRWGGRIAVMPARQAAAGASYGKD